MNMLTSVRIGATNQFVPAWLIYWAAYEKAQRQVQREKVVSRFQRRQMISNN